MRYWGRFQGILKVEILPPPKHREWWEWIFPRRPRVRVLSHFAFVDPEGTVWGVEPGDESNGISSPWICWRLVPPFTWRGIRWAVIHDVYCESRVRPSVRTHRMIYYAARADGAAGLRAFFAWLGPRLFGPRFK